MDKKISDLTAASSIDTADVSVLVHNNTDYQFNFATLLTFLGNNLSTGSAVSFGTVVPQNTSGKNGDVFVNTSAGSFAQKISGTWTVVYTLPSLGGLTDGTVLYGLGAPATGTGNNNDTYINTGTGIFYKKTAGTWTQVFTMLNGPAGVKGDKGDKGDTGTNGRTILSGTGTPSNSSDGVDGDYYINTSTFVLFGPKTAGVWGGGTPLVGPQGETGDTGATGPTGAKGDKGDTGEPGADGATGAKGDKGDDGTTGAKGDTGEPGADGATGATGAKGDKGDNGDSGATGAKGDTGDMGPTGAKGDKGDTGDTGPTGAGVPTGGTTGQILTKIDGTDYHAGWSDAASGGGSAAAGSTGQLQFNDGSGSLAATDRLSWDSSSNHFYTKTDNYGFIVDAGGSEGVCMIFKSEGVDAGMIGSRDAMISGGDSEDFCISAISGHDLYLKARTIVMDGSFAFPTYGYFGGETAPNLSFSNGTNFFWLWQYGSGANMSFTSAGNGLASSQNSEDFLINGNQNIGIVGSGGYPPDQSWVYAQFMHNEKMFIINGGNADGFIPDASAILQLDNTSRGFLPPRMTSSQKEAISSPAIGLMIYDTTSNKLCVYTGSAWETITSI